MLRTRASAAGATAVINVISGRTSCRASTGPSPDRLVTHAGSRRKSHALTYAWRDHHRRGDRRGSRKRQRCPSQRWLLTVLPGPPTAFIRTSRGDLTVPDV